MGPLLPLLLGLLSAVAPLRAVQIDRSRLQWLARGKVEVKAFINEDLPLYHNMDLKYLAGADPELILLNIQFEELQRIPLSDMSREEINQLMQELGFYRKETPDSPVPDAFQMAPANSLPPDVEALKSRHNKQKKGAGGSDL
ncbi:hypothetical protein E2320_012507 [Naja naja]|nr:hypothetical protein E2320_012507 [Naja naja]